jgi:hypothetical protein
MAGLMTADKQVIEGNTHSGRLARVDVADDDDVKVSLLLLTHFDGCG